MTTRDMLMLSCFSVVALVVTTALLDAARPLGRKECSVLFLIVATTVWTLAAVTSEARTYLSSRDRDRVDALVRTGLLPTSSVTSPRTFHISKGSTCLNGFPTRL